MRSQDPNSDTILKICIKQGYVPPDCRLDGQLVWLLVSEQEDPCAGCNENREVCKGRPKQGTGIKL